MDRDLELWLAKFYCAPVHKRALSVDITSTKPYGLMDTFVSEKLTLEQERGSSHDRFATAVKMDAMIVGQIPREHSEIYWNYLGKRGKDHV